MEKCEGKMKAEKISHIIATICKEKGIPYISSNPDYNMFVQDASRLGEIYLELKVFAGELYEIEQRHEIKGLSQVFEKCIKELDSIEHELIYIAKKINKEKK